jgi:hypothetical protein
VTSDEVNAIWGHTTINKGTQAWMHSLQLKHDKLICKDYLVSGSFYSKLYHWQDRREQLTAFPQVHQRNLPPFKFICYSLFLVYRVNYSIIYLCTQVFTYSFIYQSIYLFICYLLNFLPKAPHRPAIPGDINTR